MSRDTVLLYLPLAHNFGRSCTSRARPSATRSRSSAIRSSRWRDDSRATDLLPSVPRVFEKVHAAVRAQFEAETGPSRKLIDWALADRLRQ